MKPWSATMGDTMREGFAARRSRQAGEVAQEPLGHVLIGSLGLGSFEAGRHPPPGWVGLPGLRAVYTAEQLQAAREAGRQLGMEQARREQAQWQRPGPVTPEHPLECLIVLQSLRQSDGDWWTPGSTFLPEHQPIAWAPDTPDVRQTLGIPTQQAGDSDTP